MAHATAPYLGKDLLGLEDLSREQIIGILDTAEPFKEISERPIKKVPVLRGKTIVNAFFENSTRTRISFEFAEKRLSADTVNFAAGGSSVSKGETLVDTARNLEAMRIDMVVIRHGSSGAARFLGERIASNVINAGDGKHEHPTQGLLDLLTIRDHLGRLDGLQRLHRGRRSPLAGGALQHLGPPEGGSGGRRLRTGHADAARRERARRHGIPARSKRRSNGRMRSTSCVCSWSG